MRQNFNYKLLVYLNHFINLNYQFSQLLTNL